LQKKGAKELSPEDTEILSKAISYVCMMRLEGILSKLNDDERNEKKVSGNLMADAWKDFAKAEEKEVVTKANKLKGQIMPKMKEECEKLFKEWEAKQ
jgi:hypothetical protein